MPPQSEESERDERLSENDPSRIKDLDATEDGSQLLPDSDATIDAVPAVSNVQTQPNSDSADESPDPDATYIPSSVVQNKVKEWESSLSEDSEPGQTLKPPVATNETTASTVENSVVLKRRDISRQDEHEDRSTVGESDQPDYRTDKLLGEGGMGSVFSARQQSMDRPVAIKVLKPRAARLKSSRQAFVSEAIITGGLDHPNIVPIYDVGKQADDALFYAMKQVEGVEWKERLATNSVDENLEILLRVSDAVAFGHARYIIHRDLKPANIMLGEFGEVLVMDWGLAMPSHDHPRRNSFPRAKRGGTPHYMAPEMADDPMLGVDRRSDVYLLGAILFEIVTGKPPHTIESTAGSRRERVKACLAAVAQNLIAKTDATGELVDIAGKAMATNPADRYQTVPQFQSAVRDYIAHEESIELADQSARLLNSARQSGDYAEFSRAQFGFETALEQWPENARAVEGLKDTRQAYARTAFDRGDFDLAMSLLDDGDPEEAGLAATVQVASTERDSRTNRIQRLRRFSFMASLTIAVLASVAALWINSERNKALTAQRNAERNAYNSDMLLAQRDWESNNIGHLWDLLDKHRDRDDLKSFEWGHWDRIIHSELLTLRGHSDSVSCVAYSPDGTLLASASADHSVRVWDSVTGQTSIVLSGHIGAVTGVMFSPDGEQLASASKDKTIKIWNLVTGEELLTLKGHDGGIRGVAYSPDGQQLASASADWTVKVWDTNTGNVKLTFEEHRGVVTGVAFSSDGQLVASASQDFTVKVWEVATAQETLTLTGHLTDIASVVFSPDGQRVASASWDNTVKVWNAATGQELLTLQGRNEGEHGFLSVVFSPDGHRLASARADGTINVWNIGDEDPLVLKGHSDKALSVAFSPNSQRLSSASADSTVKVWDASTGQEALTLNGHTSDVLGVAFNPTRQQLASACADDSVKLWNMTAGQESFTLKGHTNNVLCVAFSPDGQRLASGSEDKTIRLWNPATGQDLLTLKKHTSAVSSVAFSPDGRLLASAGWDATVRVCDAASGRESFTLNGHTDKVLSVAFSPNAQWLASASLDGTVRVWDTGKAQETLMLRGHNAKIQCVAFSPDGRWLASASGIYGEPGEVRIWEMATGQERLILKGHTDEIHSVAFSPSEQRLASGSRDGVVKVWDAATGQELLTLRGNAGAVASVAFSSDGQRLAAACEYWWGSITVWDARPWTPELRAQSEARGLLTMKRDRVESIDELRASVRDDKTVTKVVRNQCLDWDELFWKNRTAQRN